MKKIVNSILGFAIGDAMGVPIEFKKREELLEKPVLNMQGYGTHDVPSGTWSDDTSMMMATIDSLVSLHKIDYDDMMKRFCDWINNAKYTATGVVFDMGITTKESILKYYMNKIEPVKCGGASINNNGNGSLMRMLPIALYTYFEDIVDDRLLDIIKNASSLTHAHEYSVMGCYIYVKYVHFLLSGYNKFKAYEKVKDLNYYKFSENARRAYKRFLTTDIYKLDLDYIKSSSYVVDTLEAVIWTFLNTNSFIESIIGAINLGDDTDTIGALVGALSGMIYGIDENLLNNIQNKDYLIKLANKFDEELRLNILKYDEVIDDMYGIVSGGEDVFFIKTEANSSIYGYQNKYLKIAKRISYKYGLTVIIANNSSDVTLENDFSNLEDYLKGNIYFMGVSNGAAQAIQSEAVSSRIKKMLLVNIPLMINLHKTKEGIKNYKGRLICVFGSKDPSFNYLPLIQDFRNVNVAVVPNQDHNFSNGDEFLYLPEKYLFGDLVVRK